MQGALLTLSEMTEANDKSVKATDVCGWPGLGMSMYNAGHSGHLSQTDCINPKTPITGTHSQIKCTLGIYGLNVQPCEIVVSFLHSVS